MNLTFLLLAAITTTMTTKKIAYEVDKTKLEGVLISDDAAAPKPGLVLVPNWLGVNEANIKQAELVAARGYTVFVADLYGTKPKDQAEAGKVSGALKADRLLIRKRMQKALEILKQQKSVDKKAIGAIGFCFGGTSALELARSGADIAGVVSFHGGLSGPTPFTGIKAKVLALHGADDPNVPPDEVRGFEEEMRAAKVDWQLVSYGGAVHSFTDVDANMPGRSQYNAAVAKRAYAAMDAFFKEVFSK